ncbi:MAG TPA: hypothetical protein DDZ96_12905 [Porphyromonadaceae bacterium]|jgi:outer membrane protein|uniref:OmpH family outer membrane protein n=1 Tax=Limibacterium fermenti TaxID=3229863 RepID=UPI000E93135F|nr:hypothetical protein [Porphyromonadaceae bacterium]HBK32000.1 hypothetical protein [Porphyromonadaceae bacterium]HBL34693.1 hypothetical protein [Porphyromonadaceae bacterium]HBX21955.1 hypothetical protein [Porphyromonadaceae bacterium]HBX45935.1 hypothetical protein [Porphyromonadaceae bacterium]
MLKKLLILFLAIAPVAAIAQDVNIAYINVQEIFAAMPEISGIETQLNTKREEVTKNGQALVDEYNKKVEEFQKTAATASETVKADQQKQLDQINERYQLFAQNSQKEVEELQQKLLSPVYKKINDAIKAIGDEKGFAYILDISSMPSPIVYNNPKNTDATPLVKTKLGLK